MDLPVSAEPKSLEQTMIQYGAGVIIITLEGARQMARALGSYLSQSRDEIAKNVAPDLMEALPRGAGEAWIDPQGKVRVGRWKLENQFGMLMFSWYALVPDSPTIYHYVAEVGRVEDQWRISSVTVRIIS